MMTLVDNQVAVIGDKVADLAIVRIPVKADTVYV
jgi:hypothetical protein